MVEFLFGQRLAVSDGLSPKRRLMYSLRFSVLVFDHTLVDNFFRVCFYDNE